MGSHWEYWSPPKWGSEMVLLFLLLSAAITLSGGAPQTHRQIRAAPTFENVCKAAEEAYRGASFSYYFNNFVSFKICLPNSNHFVRIPNKKKIKGRRELRESRPRLQASSLPRPSMSSSSTQRSKGKYPLHHHQSERGVDAAAAEEEQQRDGLEAHREVEHRLQNHQQASRLDGQQLFSFKLIIVLFNFFNSRLKIILNIVVSKHTISIVWNILFLSSLKMYKVMYIIFKP